MLRLLFLIVWAGLIFIYTCTSSLEELAETKQMNFRWTSETALPEMLDPLPKNVSDDFILRKIGHGFVFFVFAIAVYGVAGSLAAAALVSLLYAFSTEVLQLFFQRDGRLFDVMFDGAGIAAAVLFLLLSGAHLNTAKKHLEKW
ncbi:VanZ family protein [Cytobacillus oceanisediminis]|uniref:VanZ family protein n=1 Tax=Cytobacillus oceanisediminis TaxID=665099 RepID=UPI0037350D53